MIGSMLLSAQDHYINAQVKTASPGELTLMLYNGCIRFLKQAIGCINNSDIEGKHVNLVKAQNIIEELRLTLNMNYEISHNLENLYEFIQFKVNEANVKQSVEALDESITLISELRDTWAEALKTLKRGEVSSTS